MARLVEVVQTVTILSGATESNGLVLGGFLKACSVFAPSTLPETVSVQLEPTRDGVEWRTLQSGGTDVTIPAGKVAMILEGAFKKLRLLSGAAVGADRVFQVCQVVEKE